MKSNHLFVGRDEEIKQLESLRSRNCAGLVVIKGRRRIGKSRLVREFAKNQRLIEFTGLAPDHNTTAQSQLNAFAYQLAQQFGLPLHTFNDWMEALNAVSHYLKNEPTVILLDEISWMGSRDPDFIGKLKIWWDLTLARMPNVILVFCGSISTWIEKNILSSTAFFGRISLIINLQPLTIAESAALLKSLHFKGSDQEKYELLAILGGVPWYLEQVTPGMMAKENIRELCLKPEGILGQEFDRIFNDVFDDRDSIYKRVMQTLADGMRTLADIREKTQYTKGGALTKIMEHLMIAGFITKHQQWSIKTGDKGKQSLYRLGDPFMRFYLKYLEPLSDKIKKKNFSKVSIDQLLHWNTIMGFQMETLLLQNRFDILNSLGVSITEIINDNPFIQKATARKKGCQIDYLVQTKSKNLYICEFKFQSKELGLSIIDEMKEKIRNLEKPEGFGIVPVLFHLNGVSEAVIEEEYFYRIVDISDFLKQGYSS